MKYQVQMHLSKCHHDRPFSSSGVIRVYLILVNPLYMWHAGAPFGCTKSAVVHQSKILQCTHAPYYALNKLA